MQIAVFLLYINAVFTVLFGGFTSPWGLIAIAGAAAGFGIANDKRWGYWLGVAIATFGLVPFLLLIGRDGVGSALDLNFFLSLIMPLALFGLLLHQQSREYQRIWFS